MFKSLIHWLIFVKVYDMDPVLFFWMLISFSLYLLLKRLSFSYCVFFTSLSKVSWLCLCMLSHFSHVWLCDPVDYLPASSSIGFSRQEYWSGLKWTPPGDLPNLGIEPAPLISPALKGMFFSTRSMLRFISRLSTMFYRSMGLFLCQYHILLITIDCNITWNQEMWCPQFSSSFSRWL